MSYAPHITALLERCCGAQCPLTLAPQLKVANTCACGSSGWCMGAWRLLGRLDGPGDNMQEKKAIIAAAAAAGSSRQPHTTQATALLAAPPRRRAAYPRCFPASPRAPPHTAPQARCASASQQLRLRLERLPGALARSLLLLVAACSPHLTHCCHVPSASSTTTSHRSARWCRRTTSRRRLLRCAACPPTPNARWPPRAQLQQLLLLLHMVRACVGLV
jgi:hypothetical protein